MDSEFASNRRRLGTDVCSEMPRLRITITRISIRVCGKLPIPHVNIREMGVVYV